MTSVAHGACRFTRESAGMLRSGIAGLLVLTVLFGSVQADERNATSIAEFVANKDRWNQRVGQPMRLEGRYTIFTSTELRFLNCDLEFVLTRTFRNPPTSTKNIEVSGQLFRKGGGLEFHVTDLKPRESDEDLIKRRRAIADNSHPEEIYALAAWARQRGEFYDDDDLLAEADRLYREGLTIAREHLKTNDVVGLRELAAKATEVGVDQGIALRLLHEADRIEWKQMQTANVKDYRRMIGRIRQDLPGADTPLPTDRLRLRDDYQKAPLAVYNVADASTRQLLARAFYLEVAAANVLQQADENGRNGYLVAERIERDLPELRELADEYRQRELKYLTARLSRLTRTQMVELSERYKSRGEAAQAAGVIRDWLKAQESRATTAGPTELMELGDEYVNLLRDERSAARMYKLAYQQNPQLASAGQWLSTHGYELIGRQWSKPGETDDDLPDADVGAAMAEGRVQIGMTGAQVLTTLGVKPSSAVRLAFAGKIADLWVFQDFGITVRLQRRSTSDRAQVVAIGTID